MFPKSVSEFLSVQKWKPKMSESTYLTLARPSQICTAGSSAAVVGSVSWHFSNGAKLMESQKSGKIGSFFKV